jgi:hypothetical protein
MFGEEEYASIDAIKFCDQFYHQGKCKDIIFVKIREKNRIYTTEKEELFIMNIIDSLYQDLPVSFLNLDVEHPITLNKSNKVLDIINQKGAKSVIVLTNLFHSRRTRNVYRKILGTSDIKLYMLTYSNGFDNDNWWKSADGFRLVISEYLKYAYYLVRGYM